MANPSPNGIIAHPINANTNVIQGPITNKIVLDCLGIIISFTNNFNASANGCIKPHTPTAFGPHLRCIDAIIFLSATVTKAIVIKIGTNTIRISNILKNIVIYILCGNNLYYFYYKNIIFIKFFQFYYFKYN